MKLNKRILKSIRTLPPFPVTIQKVMALAGDPDSSLTELAAVIRLDQAITANILRICNSAYFGLRRPVDNVGDAIMHMGKKNVLRAVMAAGLSRYFRTAKGYDVKGGDLWEHAVAVALMSQICAARLSVPDDPRLFTAGVLHDIGKMVMGEFVEEAWQKIRELTEEKKYSFLEAEEEVIGVNHAVLGGEIALIWKFPDEILKAIAFHHRPDLLTDGDLVPWIVYLSNQVCHVMGIGVGTDALAYRAVGDVAGRLRLRQRDLEDMMAELHRKLQGARELVQIVSEQKDNGRG
ncbi:MAG TPA: HDOD domain-containing protein [Syntrophales bacterium]|nr:HDOD domain-containing protein [Syntrophales bacterium]